MRVPVLSLIALAAVAADPATGAAKTEPVEMGTKKIPVTPRKTLSLAPPSTDDTVKLRTLWFRAFDGKQWGAWQKHGVNFDRATAVEWSPNEGHWQVHLQKELTSGIKSPDPVGDVGPATELIVDRSAPAVRILSPGTGQKLKGSERYTVRWEATDAYLRNTPIAIRFSRDGSAWETVAENLANSGSFEWTTPNGHAPSAQLRIEAMDKGTNLGHAAITGLVIDSARPTGVVTAPAIIANRAITFTTELNDSGPSGLASAKLWFSQDDGTSWTEGPAIQPPFRSVAWTAPADGRFRLAVVAVDGAGNMTAPPRAREGQQFVSIVDTTAPSVSLTSNIGINLANLVDPTAQRAFAPGTDLQVRFAATDANLKPNSASIWIQNDATAAWVELGKGQPNDTAFRFVLGKDVPVVASKAARIKVMVEDLAGNVGEAVAADVFEIQTQVSADVIQITP